MDVCTIVSRRSLARARVMSSTLREHHPDTSLTVLLLDLEAREVEGLASARLLDMSETVGEQWGLLAAGNAPEALEVALLPYLMRAALRDGPALYIGPGQRVLAPLSELSQELASHEVVLVARSPASGEANGSGVVPTDGARAGIYSRSLIGLRSGPSTAALFEHWPRYFTADGVTADEAVRAWIDSIPARAADVAVLRDPGYGVDPRSAAFHSLQAASAETSTGGVLIDGHLARTFDFHELDPGDPISAFEGDGGMQLSSAPALMALVKRHAEDLQAAGWKDVLPAAPYTELSDGLRLTPTIRSLFIKAIADGRLTRSPFTERGRIELYRYLRQPERRGRAVGLSRLHMAIWDNRPDLRDAYPHIDGPDGEPYAGWLCLYGGKQDGLVAELLPPAPRLSYRDADFSIYEGPPRLGVNVVGFFTSELGVGAVARLLIAGLDAQGIPAMPIQGKLLPPSRQESTYTCLHPDEAAFPINLICINGDGIPIFAREAGDSFFANRYTIAVWFWEAGEPPPSWNDAYRFIDEVWVASRYLYDLIAPRSPVPVVRFTLPVTVPVVPPRSRAELGLPADDYTFLYIHDYHSVAARKNPIGVIEAFRRAFPPGSGAKLVIKSINSATKPDAHERTVLAAEAHPDIVFIDSYYSETDTHALIANCDCYVSLHRSEGFGLTPAEAMLLGKPVIATRYGGNVDYMSDEVAFMVDYQLVPVGDNAPPYDPDAVWAEPDLDVASSLMRRVFSNPQEASRRAQAARRYLLAHHAPDVAGAGIKRRIELILERLSEKGVRTTNLAHMWPLLQGDAVLPSSPPPPTIHWGNGRLGHLRWRAQRPIAEWARAYMDHRSAADEANWHAISETHRLIADLAGRLRDVAVTLHDEQNARHAETLALLRRLESELARLRAETR